MTNIFISETFRKYSIISYPEINDANLKGTSWTFKQQLALKMRLHYRISIVHYLQV